MRLVVFGLTVSSSWGNGHATLWRGLIEALARRGHHVLFFERDVPYYAENRDLHALPQDGLVLYRDWAEVAPRAERAVAEADAALVTSYCPDAALAERVVIEARAALKVFYDLDTPVTLATLDRGTRPSYVGPRGFADYDLVLSFTGGRALDLLRTRLGARRVRPLYGHADPAFYRPVPPQDRFAASLSYLGTYAADRQAALETLFVAPARRRRDLRFLIGGAQYPHAFPWTQNIFFARHVAPPDHPAFYSSGRITLNVTRAPMAELGHCPSGRLFEAAACGVPVLSDRWEGLEDFFAPGREILIADTTADVLAALDRGDADLSAIARAARDRVLAEHSSDRRAEDLEAALETALAPVFGQEA